MQGYETCWRELGREVIQRVSHDWLTAAAEKSGGGFFKGNYHLGWVEVETPRVGSWGSSEWPGRVELELGLGRRVLRGEGGILDGGGLIDCALEFWW